MFRSAPSQVPATIPFFDPMFSAFIGFNGLPWGNELYHFIEELELPDLRVKERTTRPDASFQHGQSLNSLTFLKNKSMIHLLIVLVLSWFFHWFGSKRPKSPNISENEAKNKSILKMMFFYCHLLLLYCKFSSKLLHCNCF